MRTETKMENQCTQQFVRSHARKASNEGLKYSTDSILSLMNNFVKAVGSMEETVLVPSRLMDVSVGSTRDADLSPSARLLHKSAPKWATKSQSDLFNFFTTIKQVHNTLMWGGKSKLENTSSNNNNNISKRARGFYSDQVSTSVPSVSVSGLDSPRSSVCPSTRRRLRRRLRRRPPTRPTTTTTSCCSTADPASSPASRRRRPWPPGSRTAAPAAPATTTTTPPRRARRTARATPAWTRSTGTARVGRTPCARFPTGSPTTCPACSTASRSSPPSPRSCPNGTRRRSATAEPTDLNDSRM